MTQRKLLTPVLGITLAASLFLTPVAGPAQGWGHNPGNDDQQTDLGTVITDLPVQELSSEEEAGLIKMREEEKLARDVYTTLYQQWSSQVFENIAGSEQQHMDTIKVVLDKYGLVDPVTDESEVGVFTDSHLQELYDSLVAQGQQSLIDALTVGATIEDLDIYDLNELIAETDNEDIQVAYGNLVKGSRNHLRTYTSQLSDNGVTYEAQFLTQEEVDEIIGSPMERGNVTGTPGTEDSEDENRQIATILISCRYLLTR